MFFIFLSRLKKPVKQDLNIASYPEFLLKSVLKTEINGSAVKLTLKAKTF